MNVLYVEDNPHDAQFLKREFSLRAPHIKVEWVETVAEAEKMLKRGSPDKPPYELILSDMMLPDGSGVSLVTFLRECGLQIPVILITGNESEENALSALRAGVDDYVLKRDGYLARLPIVFETVLHRYQAGIVREQAALKASEEYFRSLIENSSDIILVLNLEGLILYASPSVERLLEYKPEDLIGMEGSDFVHAADHHDFKRILVEGFKDPGIPVSTPDIRIRTKEGSWRYVEGIGKGTRRESGQINIILNLRDITERKLNEQKILESERSLKGILETSPIGIGRLRKRVIDWVNEEMCNLSGYTFDELKGNSTRVFFESNEDYERTGKKLYSEGQAEHRFVRKDGSIRDVMVRISPTDSYSHIFAMSDITAKKQTEDALKFTQFSVDRASNSVIWEGKNGEILYVNDAACNETGYAREELLTMTAFDIDPDVTPEKWASAWSLGTEAGASFIEGRRRHKDGRIYPVEVSSNYLNYNGNEYRCAIVRDITERKSMEAKIRESEEHYRKLIHTTPEAITIFDGDGNITYASPRSHDTFEVPPGVDVIGRSMFDYVDPDDRTKIADALQQLLNRQNVLRPLEVRLRKYDGRPFWGEVTGSFLTDESDNVKGAMAVIRDVSERKEAEEALRASQEKYRAIFENSVIGISQVTLDGRYLSLNPAQAKMFGYDSPEEMMEAVTDITRQLYVRPEERNRFLELIERHGRVEGLQTERYRKDGSRIWVSVHSQAVCDKNGKILYCQGTLEDITERKRLESQLRQAQKMEALGTLAGGIAHDFNNILTVITGYCTLLQMQMDEADPQRVFVDPIFSASQKAASLTRSLLAFSRQQPLSLKRVGLNDVVKGTEKLLKRLLTEDIALQTVYTPDDITVTADSTQIDQILFNLASNARDAMPKGGTLTIETKATTIGAEFINRHGFGEPGQYALLSLSDTGTGMDEATKEHIFDPFFTTKEVGKGTGLGLSTVYGAVKQHNGYITVSSEKQKGTTFHIFLPAVKAAPDKEKHSSVRMKRGKERILVAEDNEAVRRLVKDVLTRYGYTCIEAVDGEDAVLKFTLHRDIGLLIIDSVMPKKNGREVYDEIRKINPHIKVLFTSGYTRDVVLDKGIEEKQFDFLSKPIVPEEFLRKVREILDRKSVGGG